VIVDDLRRVTSFERDRADRNATACESLDETEHWSPGSFI